MRTFPDAVPLTGARVDLEPLRVEHADEMAPLLDDPGLHVFVGGVPESLPETRQTYRRQAVGRSPDGSEGWLNWVLRRREDGRAVGTVQATVTRDGDALVAEVAWVVATRHQRHGYAREAAAALVVWLQDQGVATLVAHVHPEHLSSQGVARAIGLAPTTTVIDGEIRWQSTLVDAVRLRRREQMRRESLAVSTDPADLAETRQALRDLAVGLD